MVAQSLTDDQFVKPDPSCPCRAPPLDPVLICFVRCKTPAAKAGKMGKAFARCQAQNLSIDLALEQSGENIDRPLGCFEDRQQAGQSLFMTRDQCVDPGVEAVKRLSMGRKDKDVIGHTLADRLERVQPVVQRIGLRFHRLHRNIRGNGGQHLIARDEQLRVPAIEHRMFG